MVGGLAAQALSLQRTLGNRATSEWLAARRAVLQRQLRNQPNVVSGREDAPLTEERGREILERLTRRDTRSIKSLVNVPKYPQTSMQEWGLILDHHPNPKCPGGEVHLIFGKGGEVNWAAYLDKGTPLAHSHPWRKAEKETLERTEGSMAVADLVRRGRSVAASIILRTVSDFYFPATRGMTKHTVFTPYLVDANGVVSRPPEQPATDQPRLVWELTDILISSVPSDPDTSASPDQPGPESGVPSDPDTSASPRLARPAAPTHQVTGRLTAKRGSEQIWTSSVRAPVPNPSRKSDREPASDPSGESDPELDRALLRSTKYELVDTT